MDSDNELTKLETLRSRSIDLEARKLLITKLSGSEQEKDLTVPPNCGGFGRIRHFRRVQNGNWTANPLPMEPACKALGLTADDIILAQVFQNAVCPWRCWYCFVPYSLLAGNLSLSDWKTTDELVDLYLAEENRPLMIDLSGGSPDLVPEWPLWMMESLKSRGMEESVYLWSDDNLSNMLFFSELSKSQRHEISKFKNYGRVCCLKGYSKESFSFNTRAKEELFETQFQVLSRLIKETEIDIYGYVTFTTGSIDKLEEEMKIFIDRLQSISNNFPLRMVPLEITVFSSVDSRMDTEKVKSLELQRSALEVWQKELKVRFDASLLRKNIVEISIR